LARFPRRGPDATIVTVTLPFFEADSILPPISSVSSSGPNQPLLKELVYKSPDVPPQHRHRYLAEAAAEAINENPLLGEGGVLLPRYRKGAEARDFIETAVNENKHDR